VDYQAYSYYVYQQVYDANHKPIEGLYVDRNGDGKINDADRYYYHNPAPDVTMGLSSKIVYKQFDFGVSMRASLGNYVYNDFAANKANVGASGVWSTSGFYVNKPTSALETNFVGKTNWYFSDYYVQNASFVRVDNITVGYTFKNLFHAISSGRLSATVQNPFVITKYKGLDPEVFTGVDNNIYPRPIMTVIGLSLNF
jgi:iron complex outermembrane receptor protein